MNLNYALKIFGGLFDLDQLETDIADYEYQMSQPNFWDDNEKAKKIIHTLNTSKDIYESMRNLEQQYEELMMTIELYDESQDMDMFDEASQLIKLIDRDLNRYELDLLLSGEHDANNAILEIHPGAGGTESQDWGSMLFRMYKRWAEQSGFQIEILDYQAGDEAGIKSVTMAIIGNNAYGYLKSEKGIHRLIRISPFDSNSRRHTSFVSVEVTPEIDDTVEVEINNDDLRVDTFRASGAGGQHINKTSSAIRITHIPTGIVTQSQSQRSQIQNRETAMKLLRAKLYQIQLDEQEAQLQEMKGEQKDIAWGSQIRSYVFHPYNMVKDHRTNVEVGNTQAVMDGDINQFIDAYLHWMIQDD